MRDQSGYRALAAATLSALTLAAGWSCSGASQKETDGGAGGGVSSGGNAGGDVAGNPGGASGADAGEATLPGELRLLERRIVTSVQPLPNGELFLAGSTYTPCPIPGLTGCAITKTLGPDGGVTFTGMLPPPTNLWAGRLGRDGAFVWEHEWKSGGDSRVTDARVLPDGKLVLVGFEGTPRTALGSGNDGTRAFVQMLGADGTQIWRRRFGASGRPFESFVKVEAVADGLVAVGKTASISGRSGAGWMAKLDFQGAVTWQRGLMNAAVTPVLEDYIADLSATSDGGLIVAAHTANPQGTDSDAWLVKLSAAGAIQWQRTYGQADGGYFDLNPVVTAIEGGYALAAQSGIERIDTRTLLIKLDETGTPVWTRRLEGALNMAEDIKADEQGNVWVSGSSEVNLLDGFMATVSGDGRLERASTIGTMFVDNSAHLALPPSGELILAAQTKFDGDHVDDHDGVKAFLYVGSRRFEAGKCEWLQTSPLRLKEVALIQGSVASVLTPDLTLTVDSDGPPPAPVTTTIQMLCRSTTVP